MEQGISRRNLLRGAGGLLAFSALGTGLLACQKSCHKEEASTNAKEDFDLPLSCEGSDQVSEDQKAIRVALRYADASPISTRTCDNCKLYTDPAPNVTCGGCKVVPGPIHPKGWCSSWYARM